jgi:hypothetical protein
MNGQVGTVFADRSPAAIKAAEQLEQLMNAGEVAREAEKLAKKNVVPPMVDPHGRYWEQPDPARMLIDDTHAVMTPAAFAELKEYSASIPSGVYVGKMWKRHDGVYDPRCKPADYRWLLCWFGESERGPDYCTTNCREILVSE